jgi:HK97 family phage prohead protease/HK97 family phage major capsid protein
VNEMLYLPQETPLEIRSDEDKRQIWARIIPYGEAVDIPGYGREMFTRGAIEGLSPEATTLFYNHGHRQGLMPIGKVLELQERDDGAYALMEVSRTTAGDEAWQLAKDRVLKFLSPGFLVRSRDRRSGNTTISKLLEISLTPFPTYQGAQVLATRSEKEDHPMSDEIKVEDNVTDPTPEPVDVEALQTRMDTRLSEFDRKLDKLQSSVEAPAVNGGGGEVNFRYGPKEWFAAKINAEFRSKPQMLERIETEFEEFKTRAISGEIQTRAFDGILQTRALADITGGQAQAGDNDPADDLSGLVVQEFMADQLVNVLDVRRPVFRNLGSIRMPRSGYAEIPTVTQNTVVQARGDQKAEAPSQKMITTNKAYRHEWLAGAVDIALEAIRTADISVLDLVWNDLLGQYAIATESDTTVGQGGKPVGVVPWIQADAAGSLEGFTYVEAALDTATYAAFIADVMEYSEAVEDATGAPATKLFVTRAQFRTLAGFVDANDRRLFSMLGATNADARVGLNANEISLPGGPTVIKGRADLTSAILTNEDAFKVADGGPERVEALNVALMGRDLGLLGRTMLVPRIPAGVVRFTTTPA